MARTKRGVISRAKHKKVFKAVKGQYGRRKNTIRVARQAMEKAMQYAYRDRKAKKREFRSLWIQRINAGVRSEGMTYSRFINALAKSKIKLDRKVLAELAYNNPEVFKAVKGQYGRRKNTIRVARQAMEKAMQYAYRDRKAKKRDFRSLWIQRINAGVRTEGLTYSRFINGLAKSKIKLDRKVLAELAYNNPEVFKSIVKKVQSSLN